jgi:hypothetical protein
MQYYISGNTQKMVEEIKRNTKGLNISKTINDAIVNNIYKQYHVYFKYYGTPEIISRSGSAVKWSRKTYLFSAKIAEVLKVDKLIILNFFLALYDLSHKGMIDYKHFDPVSAEKGQKAVEKINPKSEYFTKKPLKYITVSIVAIAAIYLVSKFKKD